MSYDANRRDLLKTGAAVGAIGAVAGVTARGVTPAEGQTAAKAVPPTTKIVKNVCHQCPARCGIDVSVTDGKVHAIYGTVDHPGSNGKLCPKGHLGAYILYDPDRFQGPMKRTNPKKGRGEDPKFVRISRDDALGIVATRLNALRDKGASLFSPAVAGAPATRA
jgi:thiosulfate reductase / polysulfide reductase chain A